MPDDCDHAQEINELHLNNALAEHFRRGMHNAGRIAEGECAKCGEDIPAARRQAIPSATLCISCQIAYELTLANWRTL